MVTHNVKARNVIKELVGNIIKELVDADKSIGSPLLKTKVLANKIENDQLYDWASKEFKGYSSDDDIPIYRQSRGDVIGDFTLGGIEYKNHPLLTYGVKNPILGSRDYSLVKYHNSIDSIASLLSNDSNDEGSIFKSFGAEICALLGENMRRNGFPGLILSSAYVRFSKTFLVDIQSSIRNNLLDFMIKIDSDFGGLSTSDLISKKEEITKIMNQTVIQTSGSGNTINTGNDSVVTVDVKIKVGDKGSLRSFLKSNSVDEAEINELLEIIDLENYDKNTNNFTNGIQTWISKMLTKSLDGSWSVGINAAGALLAEGIKGYLG